MITFKTVFYLKFKIFDKWFIQFIHVINSITIRIQTLLPGNKILGTSTYKLWFPAVKKCNPEFDCGIINAAKGY